MVFTRGPLTTQSTIDTPQANMARCLHLGSFLFTKMVNTPRISMGVKTCLIKTWTPHSQGKAISIHSAIHSDSENNSLSEEKVIIHFINQDGIKTTTAVTEGQTLLDVVVNKNLDISGFGACEGTLACSTCHLIFDKAFYEKMEPMVDEEMDMLDLAYGLTKTSRLGCQVTVQKWMDGMTVQVPQDVRDAVGSKGSQ
ncbi:ferredoxin 1b isoform X2 [Salmo salar]|uniref:Ferredoxin 1b isoform X2 n=1 Tax=Salmo salar TaxID=8030 RepID=A0A1S3RJQ2_SALSA|nr:ferredoxin 1b isoform X2 [Salmo salar]|eukprot:XP_014052520.1 PREDICTED: adrenodoxin-like isoform X2 [Salmo salar]